MASIWQWIRDHQYNGTPEQQEITKVFFAAMETYNLDNERAKSQLAECRGLAERYNEPWWAMLAEHWHLQILLHNTREIDKATEIAVRCAVETRKEKYRAFPQRVCLHEDLVYAYKHKDPIGYETEIRDAIVYMENEVAEGAECRHCIRSLKCSLEGDLGHYREAFELATESAGFADSEQSDHHLSASLLQMCDILQQGVPELTEEKYREILSWAIDADNMVQHGERYGNPKPEKRARATMWQAFAHQGLNQRDEAKRRYQTAVSLAAQTDTLPGNGFIRAAVAYHEMLGEPDKALTVAEKYLERIIGKGETWKEASWLWEWCRLRSITGQLEKQDLDRAINMTQQLKDPARSVTVLTRGAVSFEEDAV